MTILDIRLANIERHLEQAQDERTWLSKMKVNGVVAENLWSFAFERIQDEAGEIETEIEKLRRRLASGATNERAAWPSYQLLRTRSELVFRECLDLLGGLALRDRSTDDQICQLADELIYECAQPSFKVVASMPSLAEDIGDSLTTTLRRVASIRFPDWTLWTVPLVAHEYAYVMTEVEDVLRTHVSGQATIWAAAHGPDPGASSVADELRLRTANYARVLLADAFATFAMGPSYACSALLLRLDPASAVHRYRPSDATRARMILGVLGEMNQLSMGAYDDILKFLTERWGEMALLAPPPDIDAPEDVLIPEAVSAYLHKKFKYKRTGYTSQGWAAARDWAREWESDLIKRKPLALPSGRGAISTLRDALNAVWDCRAWITMTTKTPDDRDAWVGQVKDAGQKLCNELVAGKGRALGKGLPKADRAGETGV